MADPANLPPVTNFSLPEFVRHGEHPETAAVLLSTLAELYDQNVSTPVPPVADERTDRLHAVTLQGDSFTIYRTLRRASQESIDQMADVNKTMRGQLRARGFFSREYREFKPVAAVTSSVGYQVQWQEPGDAVTSKINVGYTTDTNMVQEAQLRHSSLDAGEKGGVLPLTDDLLEQKASEAAERLKGAVVLSEADLAASRSMGPASEVRGEEAIGVWQRIAPTVLTTLTPEDPTADNTRESEFALATRYVRQPDDFDGLPIRSIATVAGSSLPGEPPLLSITIAFQSCPFDSESELQSPGSYFEVGIHSAYCRSHCHRCVLLF